MGVKLRLAVTAAVALGVLVALAAPSTAWDMNQRYENTLGVAMDNLEKFLKGDVTVPRAINDKFAHAQTEPDGANTKIRWEEGTVEPGEETWACFNFRGKKVKVLDVHWTRGPFPAGPAAPVVGAGLNTESAAGDSLDVGLEIYNSWDPLIGEPGPIFVDDVYYAVTESLFVLERLTDGLFDHPSIDWVEYPSFVVATGDSHHIDIGHVPAGRNLLVRCTTNAEEEPPAPCLEVWQIPIEAPTPVKDTKTPRRTGARSREAGLPSGRLPSTDEGRATTEPGGRTRRERRVSLLGRDALERDDREQRRHRSGWRDQVPRRRLAFAQRVHDRRQLGARTGRWDHVRPQGDVSMRRNGRRSEGSPSERARWPAAT